MLPMSSAYHEVNCASGDVELLRQHCTVCAVLTRKTNRPHIIFRQFVHAVARAARMSFRVQMAWAAIAARHPAFHCRIVHVVGVRAEKQMIRPYATTIIATMQYTQSGRDRTVGQFPCDSVGGFGNSVDANQPISIRFHAAIPKPAAIRFHYSCPEPNFKRTETGFDVTGRRTVVFGFIRSAFSALLTKTGDAEHPAAARAEAALFHATDTAVFAQFDSLSPSHVDLPRRMVRGCGSRQTAGSLANYPTPIEACGC